MLMGELAGYLVAERGSRRRDGCREDHHEAAAGDQSENCERHRWERQSERDGGDDPSGDSGGGTGGGPP